MVTAMTTQKCKGNRAGAAVRDGMKEKTAEIKLSARSDHSWSVSFDSDELLLLTKAFLSASWNSRHSMDKRADKFWEGIPIHFEELVATTIKLNESNLEVFPIKTTMELNSYATAISFTFSQSFRNLLGSHIRIQQILGKSRMMSRWVFTTLALGKRFLLAHIPPSRICTRPLVNWLRLIISFLITQNFKSD